MNQNYRVYLGSACQRSFGESLEHVRAEADYLQEKGYWDFYDYDFKKRIEIPNRTGKSSLRSHLDMISEFIDVFKKMNIISSYYEAQSSLSLLLHSDVCEFKKNAYIAAKLRIISGDELTSWANGINTDSFFLPIMSDNSDLINFLINHRNDIVGSYKRTNLYSFFLKNTLLALAGDWAELKPRAEMFLNEIKRPKEYEKRVPDHEFYLALCNADIKGMETALNKLLEPKMAKRAVYDNNVWFDFYLQMQVLMYGKIASIHGFDLNIDSPIAPKELIEYKPLDVYEDPYDFMKEFDYDKPLTDWIDMWKEKMAKAKEKQKKKGFFSWFKV